MLAKPLKLSDGSFDQCNVEEATHIMLNTPGPIPTRIIPLSGRPSWTWNKSTKSPTLSPSLLTDTEDKSGKIRCHSFVRNGQIQFLNDCTHEFAGTTMPLLPVD